MATNANRGSVRIGPISIFTLVVILCLAVLAVLSVTTANAGYALTARQAAYTEDQYANEAAGQRFVGLVDQELVKVRQGSESMEQAKARLDSEVGGMAQDAATRAKNISITATASTGSNEVGATFTTAAGHVLSLRIELKADGTYQITQWKQITEWNEAGDTVTLWPGAGKR